MQSKAVCKYRIDLHVFIIEACSKSLLNLAKTQHGLGPGCQSKVLYLLTRVLGNCLDCKPHYCTVHRASCGFICAPSTTDCDKPASYRVKLTLKPGHFSRLHPDATVEGKF